MPKIHTESTLTSAASISAALTAHAKDSKQKQLKDFYRAFAMHHGFDLRKQSDINLERLKNELAQRDMAQGETLREHMTEAEWKVRSLWQQNLWPQLQLNHLTSFGADIKMDGVLRSVAALRAANTHAFNIHTGNIGVGQRCVYATLGLPGHRTADFLSPSITANKVVVDLQAAEALLSGLWIGDHLAEYARESHLDPIHFGKGGCSREVVYHPNQTKRRIYKYPNQETVIVESHFRDEVFSAHNQLQDVSDGLFYLFLMELHRIGDPIRKQLLEASDEKIKLELLQTLFNVLYRSQAYPEARIIHEITLEEHVRIEATFPCPIHVVHCLFRAAKELDVTQMQKILEAYPGLIDVRNADNQNLIMLLLDTVELRGYPDPEAWEVFNKRFEEDVSLERRIQQYQSYLSENSLVNRFQLSLQLLLKRGIDISACDNMRRSITTIFSESAMLSKYTGVFTKYGTQYGFGIKALASVTDKAPNNKSTDAAPAANEEASARGELRLRQASIGLLIQNKGTPKARILLVRKADRAGQAFGEWLFPGGLQDKAETPEETVAREIQEEIGFTTAATDWKHLTTFISEEARQQLNFYVCQADITLDPKAADDIAEAMWIPLAAIKAQHHPSYRYSYFRGIHIKPSNLLLAQAYLTDANTDDDAFKTQLLFELQAPAALTQTFCENQITEFHELLAQGADVNNAALIEITQPSFWQLGLTVTFVSKPDKLQQLLDSGADINSAQGSFTPLMFACLFKNFELARQLVTKHGANPFLVMSHYVYRRKYSALMIACIHEEGLEFIQFINQRFVLRPSHIGDMLVTSLVNRQIKTAHWLLTNFEINLNQSYFFYREGIGIRKQATPLEIAVQVADEEVVVKLLDYGADPFDISIKQGLLTYAEHEVNRMQMSVRSMGRQSPWINGEHDASGAIEFNEFLANMQRYRAFTQAKDAIKLPAMEAILRLLHAKRDAIIREYPIFFPKAMIEGACKEEAAADAASEVDDNAASAAAMAVVTMRP